MFNFDVYSLFLFLINNSEVIAITTIVIAITVALSLLEAIAKDFGVFCKSCRTITLWGSIQKRSHEPMKKTDTIREAKIDD